MSETKLAGVDVVRALITGVLYIAVIVLWGAYFDETVPHWATLLAAVVGVNKALP